jgi:shikimate kinase
MTKPSFGACEQHSSRVVLIGLPSTGKTTVGDWLADEFGWMFFDCDSAFESETGTSIVDWTAEHGWPAFRQHESEILERALKRERVVVSSGGGCVESQRNRTALATATVVWLDAPLDVLLSRLGAAADRPLLAGDPRARLGELAARRKPLYAELADICVEASGTAEEVVGAIMEALLPDESS